MGPGDHSPLPTRKRLQGLALRLLVTAVALGPVLLAPGKPGEASRLLRGSAPQTSGPWATGYRRHSPARIVLAYDSPGGVPWTADRLRYYVTHVQPDGKADDWFFDTVLFLALASDSERSFCPGFGKQYARAEDWLWYLDQRLFGGHRDLAELEEAVHRAGQELHERSHIIRVIIMVPYPDPRSVDFGAPEGRPLNLSRTEDRAAAVRWYLREVAQRWSRARLDHLRLAGFYWVHEAVPEEDRALLRQVWDMVGNQLLPLYWIPYFGAEGNHEWHQLGFDIAIQQPNYYFYDVPPERLEEASGLAHSHRMGVELELDRRVLTSKQHRDRYQLYLQKGAEHGYQRAGILAWYDDTALLEAAQSRDPEVRSVYDATYAFLRASRL